MFFDFQIKFFLKKTRDSLKIQTTAQHWFLSVNWNSFANYFFKFTQKNISQFTKLKE